jgi:hypothetical protein
LGRFVSRGTSEIHTTSLLAESSSLLESRKFRDSYAGITHGKVIYLVVGHPV